MLTCMQTEPESTDDITIKWEDTALISITQAPNVIFLNRTSMRFMLRVLAHVLDSLDAEQDRTIGNFVDPPMAVKVKEEV